MAENKNIKLFYEKGYITQFQQCAMFIFSRMFGGIAILRVEALIMQD